MNINECDLSSTYLPSQPKKALTKIVSALVTKITSVQSLKVILNYIPNRKAMQNTYR